MGGARGATAGSGLVTPPGRPAAKSDDLALWLAERKPALRRHAKRLTADHDIAIGAVDYVEEKFWENGLDRITGPPFPYLRQCVTNRVWELHREKDRRWRVTLKLGARRQVPEPAPGEQLIVNEEHERVRAFMEELPEGDRMIFELLCASDKATQ
jgi:DNA-directed RNA polymerase specialized sigma24 family protein